MSERYFNPMGLTEEEKAREQRRSAKLRKRYEFWTLERRLMALGVGCLLAGVAIWALIAWLLGLGQ